MDADGQHTVADAQRVAQCSAEHPGCMVLGSRTFGKNTPLRSRWGNRITRRIYQLCSGCRVRDTQTGLRGFSSVQIPFLLSVPGERYEYEMNVLSACPRQHIPFLKIPIETIYENHNKGSHFHTVKDSFRIYRNLLMFSASSFFSFLTDYALYSLFIVLSAGLGTVGIPLSNVTARVISAAVNFTINKHFVFQNKDSVLKTGVLYFLLAAGVLTGNTLLLSLLVNVFGTNPFLAKLITEITFFFVSWLVQRGMIFHLPKKDPEGR